MSTPLRSFIEVAPDSHFPIQNLPFGIFQPNDGPARGGVALGDLVLDLALLEECGYFRALNFGPRPVFAQVTGERRRDRAPAPATGARDAGGAFLGIAADGRSGWDGVRLGSIVPGSAAERAGLRAGDVLVRLDETGLAGFADLRAVLDRRRPGDALALVYLRDGVDHATTVTLGTRP